MVYCREKEAKRFRDSLKAHVKDLHEGSNQRCLPSLLNKSKDQGIRVRTMSV